MISMIRFPLYILNMFIGQFCLKMEAGVLRISYD